MCNFIFQFYFQSFQTTGKISKFIFILKTLVTKLEQVRKKFREFFLFSIGCFAFFQDRNAFFRVDTAINQEIFFFFPFPGMFSGFSDDRVSPSARINFSNGESGYNFVRTKPQKPNAMKTIAKTLITAITLLFAMQVIAAPINEVPMPSKEKIQYAVKINTSQIHTGVIDLNLFVMMTDENGKLVAPVQTVRPGLSTYYFHESGSVKGTRVARMTYDPTGPSYIIFYCAPDSKTGKFVPGATYLFNLTPSINAPKPK
jgi:hypothetical protein